MFRNPLTVRFLFCASLIMSFLALIPLIIVLNVLAIEENLIFFLALAYFDYNIFKCIFARIMVESYFYMKECGISGDSVMGHICRGIPGIDIEDCYFWQAAQLESAEAISGLRAIVEKHLECPFQKEVLAYIEQRRENNEDLL